MRTGLYEKSIQVILENQTDSGAYLACPTFPTYRYSWFRDGSYIARSMDMAGQPESAESFHSWAMDTILCRRAQIEDGIENAKKGRLVNDDEILHTRYATDGKEGAGFWENFQLDGIGTWLWSLESHLTGQLRGLNTESASAVRIAADYLAAHMASPCYDCWEEFGDRRHIYTMAAVSSGLNCAGRLLGIEAYHSSADELRRRILTKGISNGHLCKFEGTDAVDSNLIGVSVPYGLLEPGDPVMSETIRKIETDLLRSGGLHRYASDTFYGGGIWILLTAWLGWYYSVLGKSDRATNILAWVDSQVDEEGYLAEQITDSLLAPVCVSYWQEKWGTSAKPLLWSHAMYIILCHEIDSGT